MQLDERGIPITSPEETHAPACPPSPCQLCTGNSAVLKRDGTPMSSWEWCQSMKTCGATVDWERIFNHA